MHKNTIALVVCGVLAAPLAQAGTLTVDHADLKLTGGVAAAAVYSSDYYSGTPAPDQKNDLELTDFLAELSMDPAQTHLGFTVGFGRFLVPNALDGGKNRIYANSIYDSFKVQYGYLTLAPTSALTVDLGIISTNVGYELVPTFKNPHVTTSALWNGQPGFYPGARATYAVTEAVKVYAEVNNLEFVSGKDQGSAFGVLGSAGPVNYVVNYMVMNDYKNIVDLVLTSNMGGVDVGANIDYNKMQCPTTCADDKAWGVALYVRPKMDKFSFPVRLEYLDDGAGVYVPKTGIDLKKAYVLTFTPTYHYADNAFVRAEVSYVAADDKAFMDKGGNLKDNKISAALQAGVTF